jgi:flagella basal body P-ring formation protein FlgA
MRTLLTLILVLGLAMATSAAPGVTVVVRPASEVAGEKVTLGDIASIQGADAEQSARLKSILVCPSPLPGKARKLTDDQVITTMRRAGILPENAGLLCPPEIAVVRTSAIVGSADLVEAARKHILAVHSWTGTVSVEAAIPPGDQVVSAGKLDLRIKAGTSAIRKGRNSIPVEIVIDDKVYRTVQVSVTIKVIAPVAVAVKSIARSEQIGTSNIAIEERDVTLLPDDVMISMPEAGWTASLPISEGSILRRSWVSAPPSVRSGDQVLVVVSCGTLRLTERGAAAQDGCIGDRIKVRLSGAGREVRATVSGQGLVEIIIGRRK